VRTTFLLAGVVLVAIGVVWILQGSGALAGSFMTGSRFWEAMGVIALAAGLAAIGREVLRVRRR